MKKPAVPTSDPALLAVLHRAGRAWHALIANTRTQPPTVAAVREFPQEQVDRIETWLTEQQIGSVLCVLPAAQVICRTVPLPNAPAEQLEPALRLQAEAHLLGIAPAHRLVMAVLPAAPGEATRSGIILAWPESAEFLAPVTQRSVRYIPDVACLAGLLNGQRPADPMLWLDRGDGSVAVAVTHSGGATFRATREEPNDSELWKRSVGRIVAETSLNVGHTGSFVEHLVNDARTMAAAVGVKDAALFVPAEVRDALKARLQGAGDDRWWKDHGIAAGAVLVQAGALAPLAQLQHTPPIEQPSRIRNTLEALSRPRAAATVVLACVLLMMLSPLVFNWLRLMALKVRYGDVQQQLVLARTARDQVAVYRELEKQEVWPMTKLLSDIATNAPLGIELDIMRLDAGKDFSISGNAIAKDGKTPSEIVALMCENLRADGLFKDIALSVGDANNLGVYKFDITGKVSRPFLSAKYPVDRDFLAWSHPDRRDGKPAQTSGKPTTPKQPDATAMASAASSDSADGSTAADTGEDSASPRTPEIVDPVDSGATAEAGDAALASADPDAGGGSGSRRPTNLSGSGVGDDPTVASDGATAGAQIPPPITQAEIEAMSQAELQKALASVSKARPLAKGDAELENRLKNEFNMLMTQLRKVKGAA